MAASGWASQGPLGAFQFFPPFPEKQPGHLISSPILTANYPKEATPGNGTQSRLRPKLEARRAGDQAQRAQLLGL